MNNKINNSIASTILSKKLICCLLAFSAVCLIPSRFLVAAPLQDGTYTYNITSSAPPSGNCTGPTDDRCSHILNSITIAGITYDEYSFPTGFSVGGFPLGSNVQSRIYDVEGDYVFSDPTYSVDMLANVFSDADLNRYQQVDSNANLGFSEFVYSPGVPTTSEFYLITTERNGNNSQFIEAFNGATSLGTVTVNANSNDYSATGAEVGFNQDSNLAVIPMTDFFDPGDPTARVTSIRITFGTTNDGPDHKTFIIGSPIPAVIDAIDNDYTSMPINAGTGGDTTSVLLNDTLNGVVLDPNDIILNSTGTAQDGSSLGLNVAPSSGNITMNGDGTITVDPGTEAGTYLYTYEICEDLVPTNCDVAVATVLVVPPVANLSISKGDGQSTYTPGSSFTYTLTVINDGPDAANGSTVSDDIPDWAENVTWSCVASNGAVCPNASGNGDISEVIATLPNSGELVYTILGNFSADMSLY